MKVLIVAVGSMGDVVPYTGLAVRLREAGHEVAVATYERFTEIVRRTGAELRVIPGDPAVRGEWTQAKSSSRAMRGITAKTVELGERIFEVAKQGQDDLILLSMPAMPGVHAADRLGIPSAGVFFAPMHPASAHPPSFVGIGRSLGPWGNRAAGNVLLAVAGMLTSRPLRELRARLGLRPLSRRELTERMDRWPIFYAYSPSVLPRPADWAPALEVSGYLWPNGMPGWTPPAELVDFLEAGPRPVFVGFGSRAMSDEESRRVASIVEEALSLAGVRGVIHAGWAELTTRSAQTITVREPVLPHDWLFPRMAAVVHHMGAGTAAAGLRAGVPSVGVPILGDQPFWAGRIAALGAGPEPVPYRKLSAGRLAAAISDAVSDRSYQETATALSRRIAAEDGAGTIIAALDRLVDWDLARIPLPFSPGATANEP